jgi:hypothetical protein
MSYISNETVNYSFESFGIDMDRAEPDLRMNVIIAIMRFHADLSSMMLPVRPTSEPAIRYTKERAEVYDLGDASATFTPIVDLYENPEVVDNSLKPIIPLEANDPGPGDGVVVPVNGPAGAVVVDGVLAFNKEANILELSIDASKPGYSKINITDLVSDGMRVKSVFVEVTSVDGSNPAVVDQFEIPIPKTIGRLTRNANNLDVAERMCNFEHVVFYTNGAVTTSGTPSVILNDATSNATLTEGFQIKLLVSAKFNLKNGIGWASCGAEVVQKKLQDTENFSSAWDTAFANITDVAGIGYILDAKFSEENMRKSSIAVRTARQSLSYEIPQGRNYVIDYSLAQDNAQSNAATLTRIIRIGQGRKVLRMIIDTLESVAAQVAAYQSGAVPADQYPGRWYVAGEKVRPFVMSDLVFDVNAGMNSITDAGRSGDIKERALLYLNSVISDLETNSFFNQQLAPGVVPHYTLVTTNHILDNVLAQKHTHDHLDNSAEPNTGIEYRLVAPCGAVIDVVTTTDTYLGDRILLYPSLPASKESVLNFGHNWDYGTIVGHYTLNDGHRGANNRLFANTRELPLPTNPVGAIITVVGVDLAVFR